MVEGLLHPGFKRIAIQTSQRADINDNRLLTSTEVRALTPSSDPNHPTGSYPFTSKSTPNIVRLTEVTFVNLDLPVSAPSKVIPITSLLASMLIF